MHIQSDDCLWIHQKQKITVNRPTADLEPDITLWFLLDMPNIAAINQIKKVYAAL